MLQRISASRRTRLIAVPAVAVVVVLAGSLLLVSTGVGTSHASPSPTASPTPSPTPTASPSPTPTPVPIPTPTPFPSGMAYAPLDGVLTTTALANREAIAIMVDDNKVARPQSGISSASIVYQAPADGGEDRYMMVFQEGTASAIGPVRSARPYYVYWANEYKAVFGHYGGDSIARHYTIPQAAAARSIFNLDALSGSGCAYHRVNTRPSPHNAYTSTGALLTCIAKKKGYPTTYQKMPTRTFTDDSPIADRPSSQNISIVYRTGTVGYQYNWVTNSYLRLINGGAEIDPANNSKVYARSIVVMYQNLYYAKTEPNHNRPQVQSVGSGKALIFQEGKETIGTWKKKSNTALTRFYDATGKEISLVRGEIFIQSIPPSYKVTVG